MVDGRFQITVDLEYTVKINGEEYVNEVYGIPLLQKMKSKAIDQEDCYKRFKGKMNFEKVCDHYA